MDFPLFHCLFFFKHRTRKTWMISKSGNTVRISAVGLNLYRSLRANRGLPRDHPQKHLETSPVQSRLAPWKAHEKEQLQSLTKSHCLEQTLLPSPWLQSLWAMLQPSLSRTHCSAPSHSRPCPWSFWQGQPGPTAQTPTWSRVLPLLNDGTI